MDIFSKKQIESELKVFASRNFADPSECRNLDQVRFYIRELSDRMQYLHNKYDYVPVWAYQLMAQYNARLDSLDPVPYRKIFT